MPFLPPFLPSLLYVLKHAAILVSLIISSCGLGSVAATLFKVDHENQPVPFLEKTFFFFCLGLAVWSYAIFCLGVFNLIYKAALIVIFALSLLPYVRLIRRHQKQTKKEDSSGLWVSIILLGVITIPVFIRSLYGANSWDDTMYHLPVARAFLDSHYLIPTPFLRYTVFNNFTNLLFVPLLAFGGDTAASQASVASFIFCGIGIYAFLKRFNSQNAGLLGLLAWSSSPFLWDLGSTAIVDMNLALIGLAGTFAALKAIEAKDKAAQNTYSFLAGIFFGCTVAIKLLGALLVVSFMSAVNVINFFAHQMQWKQLKPLLLMTLKISVLAVIMIAPWLIRSYIVTGNPIWPFGEKIFGLGTLWSAYDYNSQADSLAATKGLTRTAFNFLILPWLVSFKSAGYEQLAFLPFLAPGVYLGFPLLFVKGYRSSKILFGTVLCFLFLWFISTQQVRYLMAAAPTMCLLAGAVLDRYLNAFVHNSLARKRITQIAAVLVIVFGFEHVAYADMCNEWHRLPYDKQHRTVYLQSRLPLFTTVNMFSLLPPGRVYGLKMENMQYFTDGRMIGDWFGPARYEDFRRNKATGESLYKHLNSLGVQYLAVDLKNPEHFELPKDATFDRHFRNIFTDGTGAIYKLH